MTVEMVIYFESNAGLVDKKMHFALFNIFIIKNNKLRIKILDVLARDEVIDMWCIFY